MSATGPTSRSGPGPTTGPATGPSTATTTGPSLLLDVLARPLTIGAGVALAVVALIWLLGAQLGRAPGPPWVCDDTRYVDTVPAGRGVVGPAVSAPPGCGR